MARITTLKTTRKRKVKKTPEERRRVLRNKLFRGSSTRVWSRTDEDGFSTIPRTLPLIGTLIRLLTDDLDASRAYFDLWGRVYDEGLVDVTDEEEFAASCGYATPSRNVRTWRERIETLVKLGFVEVQPKGTRKYGYILLVHPLDMAEKLRQTRKQDVPDWWWSLFQKRVSEIGATLRVGVDE